MDEEQKHFAVMRAEVSLAQLFGAHSLQNGVEIHGCGRTLFVKPSLPFMDKSRGSLDPDQGFLNVQITGALAGGSLSGGVG